MGRSIVIVLGSPKLFRRYSKIFDAIEARGHRPFPVTHSGAPGSAPGLMTNLLDFNTAFDAVHGATGGESVAGLFCAGETYVNTASLMASMLGLTGPGLRAGTVSRNKFLQRVACSEFSPRWCLRKASADDWDVGFPGPYVVKPTFRHSSSGVVRVESPAELAELMGSGVYQGYEDLLVEEHIEGREFSVESMVHGGAVVFSSVSETKTGELPYFVEVGHCVPATSLGAAERDRLVATNAGVVAAIGVEDSVTHAEYRIAADGRVYLMEIAVRLPGDGFSLLYQAAYGISLEEQAVAVSLGEMPPVAEAGRVAVQRYVPLPGEGRLGDIAVLDPEVPVSDLSAGDAWPDLPLLDAEAAPCLRAVLQQRPSGAELPVVRESDDRSVAFVVDGPIGSDPDELAAMGEKLVRVGIDRS
jgi:hypothetical protein